ncbi:hypothetical protein ACFL2I_06465, partial [Candidatus Omnitrophota bacterium]
MELTKIEKRILNSEIKKSDKIVLWIGMLLIIGAITSIFLTAIKVKDIHDSFTEQFTSMHSEFFPKTERESKVAKSLFEAHAQAHRGWIKYTYARGLNSFQSLLFVGAFLVGVYYLKTIYINLIKKLKTSS